MARRVAALRSETDPEKRGEVMSRLNLGLLVGPPPEDDARRVQGRGRGGLPAADRRRRHPRDLTVKPSADLIVLVFREGAPIQLSG